MPGALTHRRWLVSFVIVFISSVALASVINIIVDPYGLFHIIATHRFNFVKRYVSSDRMTKVYYLARVRPRTLLLGSSTIGSFDPGDLTRYTPSPVYNLALGGAHIREMHAYLAHAASRYPVSMAVIGLDFSSFFPHDRRTGIHPGFAPERLSPRLFVSDYFDSLFSIG